MNWVSYAVAVSQAFVVWCLVVMEGSLLALLQSRDVAFESWLPESVLEAWSRAMYEVNGREDGSKESRFQ